MRSALGSLVIAAVLFAAPVASADGTATAASDAPAPRRWYGYQTLATDGAALTLAIPAMMSSGSGAQSTLGLGALLTYGLGGPIVHLAHGQVGKGFLDLCVRGGMPFILGLLGAVVGAGLYTPPTQPSCNPRTDSFCGLGDGLGPAFAAGEGAALGGLLGIGGAVAIDAAVIAREGGPTPKDDWKDPDAEPRTEIVTARWQPVFGVTPERQGGARATVGLVGTF